MKLREFAFFTDENIHPGVIIFLRGQGCDVLDVKESGLTGSADLVILRKALAENRVILTHDSDFGTLALLAGEPVAGIVYLRPGHISPAFTTGTLGVLIDQNLDLTPPFIIVAQRTVNTVRIRVRKL